MGKGYHFYRRVDKHEDALQGRAAEVERAARAAAKGIAHRVKVHVHPTHVHVFADVSERKKFLFSSRIREGIGLLEGIRWDTEHYLTPVSSLDSRYVSRLLRDLHAQPLI